MLKNENQEIIYEFRNFLKNKNFYGLKRKKYLNLKAKVKPILTNSKNYHWFVISTNQTNYFQDFTRFIKNFKQEKFDEVFNLYKIKINYSGSKDFNIKIFGWKVLFEYIKNLPEESIIIFTDLDFHLNNKLKKLILSLNPNFLYSWKVKRVQRSIGSLFFGKKNKVLKMELELDKYLETSLDFNYEDEKILFKNSEKNLYDKIFLYFSADKINNLSYCRYRI